MKIHRPHPHERETVKPAPGWSNSQVLLATAAALVWLVLPPADLWAHDPLKRSSGQGNPGRILVTARTKSPESWGSGTQAAVARLTLRTTVVNNNGGTAHASAWTLSATGPTSFSGPGPSEFSPLGFEPGTYHLSESGGPTGYIASSWNCTGAKQHDRDSVTLQTGDNATCIITNNDVAANFQVNAGHGGAWYFPDTSGQGQFIALEPASGFMFLGWFTYTDTGSAHPLEQQWLTAEGFFTGNIAELIVYRSSGGKFGEPQDVATEQVGDALVEFHDCESATMRYRLDPWELAGEFPLVRVIPGSDNFCVEFDSDDAQPTDINIGWDGAWYDPATSGQGFFIDMHDNGTGSNFVFVSWFTYGDTTASGRRWLTAEGNVEGSTAELVIYDTNGGTFDDPLPLPESVAVGSMTIDFIDCDSAVLTYALPGEDLQGEIPITRLVPLSVAQCEGLAGLK